MPEKIIKTIKKIGHLEIPEDIYETLYKWPDKVTTEQFLKLIEEKITEEKQEDPENYTDYCYKLVKDIKDFIKTADFKNKYRSEKWDPLINTSFRNQIVIVSYSSELEKLDSKLGNLLQQLISEKKPKPQTHSHSHNSYIDASTFFYLFNLLICWIITATNKMNVLVLAQENETDALSFHNQNLNGLDTPINTSSLAETNYTGFPNYTDSNTEYFTNIEPEKLPEKLIKTGDLPKVIKWIEKNQNNINNIRNEKNQTALHLATDAKRLDVMRALLEAKIDPSAKDLNRSTALHYAAHSDFKEGAELLISNNASTLIINKFNFSPFESAAINQKFDTAKQIFELTNDQKVTLEFLKLYADTALSYFNDEFTDATQKCSAFIKKYSNKLQRTNAQGKDVLGCIYGMRGLAYFKTNSLELAQKDLKKASELSAPREYVYRYLAFCAFEFRQSIEVQQIIEQGLRLFPDNIDFINFCAHLSYSYNNYYLGVQGLQQSFEQKDLPKTRQEGNIDASNQPKMRVATDLPAAQAATETTVWTKENILLAGGSVLSILLILAAHYQDTIKSSYKSLIKFFLPETKEEIETRKKSLVQLQTFTENFYESQWQWQKQDAIYTFTLEKNVVATIKKETFATYDIQVANDVNVNKTIQLKINKKTFANLKNLFGTIYVEVDENHLKLNFIQPIILNDQNIKTLIKEMLKDIYELSFKYLPHEPITSFITSADIPNKIAFHLANCQKLDDKVKEEEKNIVWFKETLKLTEEEQKYKNIVDTAKAFSIYLTNLTIDKDLERYKELVKNLEKNEETASSDLVEILLKLDQLNTKIAKELPKIRVECQSLYDNFYEATQEATQSVKTATFPRPPQLPIATQQNQNPEISKTTKATTAASQPEKPIEKKIKTLLIVNHSKVFASESDVYNGQIMVSGFTITASNCADSIRNIFTLQQNNNSLGLIIAQEALLYNLMKESHALSQLFHEHKKRAKIVISSELLDIRNNILKRWFMARERGAALTAAGKTIDLFYDYIKELHKYGYYKSEVKVIKLSKTVLLQEMSHVPKIIEQFCIQDLLIKMLLLKHLFTTKKIERIKAIDNDFLANIFYEIANRFYELGLHTPINDSLRAAIRALKKLDKKIAKNNYSFFIAKEIVNQVNNCLRQAEHLKLPDQDLSFIITVEDKNLEQLHRFIKDDFQPQNAQDILNLVTTIKQHLNKYAHRVKLTGEILQLLKDKILDLDVTTQLLAHVEQLAKNFSGNESPSCFLQHKEVLVQISQLKIESSSLNNVTENVLKKANAEDLFKNYCKFYLADIVRQLSKLILLKDYSSKLIAINFSKYHEDNILLVAMRNMCSHIGQAIRNLPNSIKQNIRDLLQKIPPLMVNRYKNVFEHYRNAVHHDFSEDNDNFIMEEIPPDELLSIAEHAEEFLKVLETYLQQQELHLEKSELDLSADELRPDLNWFSQKVDIGVKNFNENEMEKAPFEEEFTPGPPSFFGKKTS